jgi:hypothetical protein
MFPFFGSSNAPEPMKPPFHGLVELDDYLMSLNQLPKDLAIQISKSGSNTIGGPKLSLELGIGLNDYVYMTENAKKEARANYGSYNPELRVNALSEVEANILVNYITPEGMQTLLASQRSLRVGFQKQQSSEEMRSPQAYVVDIRGKPTPAAPRYEVPLFAYEVLFVDQNGNRKEMPYKIKCRGTFNFLEAYQLTKGGINTAQMSLAREFTEAGVADTQANQMQAVRGANAFDFPKSQAVGNILSDSYYHLLWQWGDMLRGTAEITVQIPSTITDSDWSHERVRSYDRVLNKNQDVEFAGTKKSTPNQVLFTSNYKLDATKPEVFKIEIPIFVEPLPNHLVMTSGGIKSKWSVMDDVNNLPDHQKVSLNLRLARPRSSELWANADFNDDFAISYDEYISPEGVAARRAGRAGASPVPDTEIVFSPDPLNDWLASKRTYSSTSNVSGFLNITLPPGRWTVSRTTDQLVRVADGYDGARSYEMLSLIEQGLMAEEYGDSAPNYLYARNTIPMAKISVPAAFYWRETDEYDTTPVAVVGAKLIQDMTGVTQDVLSGYELRENVPSLKSGLPATADSIYQKMKGMHPNIDKAGYPIIGSKTTTSRHVFDTAVMMFKEDSPYDLSLVGEHERRLESVTDSTVTGINIPMPNVGGTVDYNGYVIKRVIIDATTEYENSLGYYPGMEWNASAMPFSKLPESVHSTVSQGDYTTDEGRERVITIRLNNVATHPNHGKSFEALVYYKEHTAEQTEIISLYGIELGKNHKKRLNDAKKIAGENAPITFYQDQIESLHMWSTSDAAIIAGQFIPIQAPTHHTGWQTINSELSKKNDGQFMLEAMRAIDSGGKAKFPAGEAFTDIHQNFGGPDTPLFEKAIEDSKALALDKQTMPELRSLIENPNKSMNWAKQGSHYPGSMVFFESDVFPTALVTFPAGYDMTAMFSGSQYFGTAQAHVDFVQDAGYLQAPQPFVDEDDEYNMGFGML